MILNKFVFNYTSRTSRFYLIPIGDIHLGNRGCDIAELRRLIQWVKDNKDVYWIGMGDYCDCINYTDPRFDPQTVDDKYSSVHLDKNIQLQTEDFIHLIRPIADKCLGLHRGNHEEEIRRRYIWDIMHEVHKEYPGIKMLEDTAITRLMFHRRRHTVGIDVFSQHGRVGGMKGGNKINRLEDMIGYIDADIYLMAHAHIKTTEMKTQLFMNGKMHLCKRKIILGVTGSFLRGYMDGNSSYVEKAMLPPTDLGVIKITITPDSGDIHVSI